MDLSGSSSDSDATDATSVSNESQHGGQDVYAIIGMSGRFPGAETVDELWSLFTTRGSGITVGSNGSSPKDLQDDEIFVPAYGSMKDVDSFDAAVWSMDKADAKSMDPQVPKCLWS